MSTLPLELVEQLISRWKGEEGSSVFVNEGTNTIFGFRANGRQLVLRVHHTGDRDEQGTLAELDWVYFLHKHGVKVGWPVVSATGRWVETAEWEGKVLLAAVFCKAPGRHPRLHSGGKWNSRLLRRIGRTLGRMHALNRSYEPPAGLRRFDWSQIDLPRFAEGITPAEESGYLENLRAHWQWIQSLPRDDPEFFGLIHGDFHSANLLTKRSSVTVIDFDGACYNWYLFDIAHLIGNSTLSLGEMGVEERTASVESLFRELMRGYIKENRMKSDWFEFLPGFLRGSQLLYYFNLLANFQGDREKREKAPHYDLVRNNVLNNRPLVEVDFRKLYKEVETPRLVRWVIRHIIKPGQGRPTPKN